MVQDNDDFRSRAADAVFAALIDAGRVKPGAADTHIDVDRAVEAMAQAMSSFIASISQAGIVAGIDREAAAAEIDRLRGVVVSQLEYFAKRVREGTFPEPERSPPTLRVVD